MDTLIRRIIGLGSALALGLLAPMSVLADGPSYNYFEIGYVNADIDEPGADIDGDGFGIGGSVGFAENWFMFANYADLGFDFGIDVNTFDVGFGYHYPMSDTTDFAVTAEYARAEAKESGFGSIDDDGYGVGLLIRSMLSDAFELNGGINYVDFGGTDGSDTSFTVGGIYSFTDTVGFGARVEMGDDVTLYQLGFRFYFNK